MFDLVYGGVASDYSIPTGKNRYHKFKDKIVEVWCALEQDAPPDHHARDKAVAQLEVYRAACGDVKSAGISGTPKRSASAAGGSRMSAQQAKRGYAGPPQGVMYKHLDEAKVIETLPEPLQSLLHLRQMEKEMTATTSVKITKKNLEDHSKKVDTAYMEAVTEFAGGDDSDDKKNDPILDKDEAYARAQALALLYRYANAGIEQKMLSDAYQKAVDQYVGHVAPQHSGEDSINV
ncbi:MAG: hypothetical protein SGILL_002761 [Bacillariaceae sp.]